MGPIELPKIAFHGTRAEQTQLIDAVLASFGACTCTERQATAYDPRIRVYTPVTIINACAGHLFMIEQDEPGRTSTWYTSTGRPADEIRLTSCVSRLDRLLFVKRMSDRFRAQEHSYTCVECGREYPRLSPSGSSERCLSCRIYGRPSYDADAAYSRALTEWSSLFSEPENGAESNDADYS